MTDATLPDALEAEHWFGPIVEALPCAIVLVDAAAKIALLNRNAEELFGYRREELTGLPLGVLVPERFRLHAAHVANFLMGSEGRALGAGRELFGRRKDGTEVPLEIGLNPMQTEQGCYTLASIVDISERKRRQIDLQRSHADLEQFAHLASHDLQEPLRMVASYTELLAERYQGQLDERADRYISHAAAGAKRMQRLLTDLLTYSRVLSQGKALLPVSVEAPLRWSLGNLRDEIREANATVEFGELPTVLADEDQLAQLLQHLIDNALKFRADRAPLIRIGAVSSGADWQFSIRDHGIGIAEQHFERIFQVFQRLHERGKYEGSGAGLAIAKRIVERHGGRIWLESEPGIGSTFYFTLRGAPARDLA